MVQETTSKSSEESIIEQLTKQIETYLAPKSLESDAKLSSKLTESGAIHIDVLADLKLIKKLSSDRDIIVKAIEASPKLKLGNNKLFVSPIYERKTLILREIPTDTPRAEINKIIASPPGWTCPPIVDIHSDIGNNWFVTFKTEDDCVEAAMKIRTKGNFKGERVAVRIKSQRMNVGPPKTPRPPAPVGLLGAQGCRTRSTLEANRPSSAGTRSLLEAARSMASARLRGCSGGCPPPGECPACRSAALPGWDPVEAEVASSRRPPPPRRCGVRWFVGGQTTGMAFQEARSS